MSKVSHCIIFLFAILFMVGCRPYNAPVFEEVNTSETAFLVPLTHDGKTTGFTTESEIESTRVNAQRIQIPRTFIQEGYFWTTGKFMPVAKLIKVDRAPVTTHWDKETKNAIWVESKDSIGFSTGIALTARIRDDKSAVKFLHNYPSGSLKDVLDKEVRARVQKIFAEQAAAEDINVLREKKNDIIKAVETDVVPFFSERGIEITSLGQFGGFTYENEKTQEAIDKVYQAQQDKDVAIAESQAAEERKNALKLTGEGQAAQKLEAAKGEAEAIKLKADAKEYEVQKITANSDAYIRLRQLELQEEYIRKWTGTLPVYMLGAQSDNLMQILPTPPVK